MQGVTVGYASGLGVAGVIVAIGIFIGLQEVESEQCELDAVQKSSNSIKNYYKDSHILPIPPDNNSAVSNAY